MADYLLDTGILIRHLRNRPGYRELLHRLAQEGQLIIASLTRLEVIQGMRDHEREATFALLDALQTHPLDAPTADLAGEMIRAWRKKGITLGGPDAVIAASALRCRATLVTTNPRHFPMEDLPVLRVDEEGNLRRR
ncbi:MAG: type II toxin-antitoxin system VapC family toxin [Anaerolineae bacterium]